jgi:hypothetical protein
MERIASVSPAATAEDAGSWVRGRERRAECAVVDATREGEKRAIEGKMLRGARRAASNSC